MRVIFLVIFLINVFLLLKMIFENKKFEKYTLELYDSYVETTSITYLIIFIKLIYPKNIREYL